jgi:hypothetical protein
LGPWGPPKGTGPRLPPFITFTVLIFTTDGLAFFASWEKDPGAAGSTELVWASIVKTELNSVATKKPVIRQKRFQPVIYIFFPWCLLLFMIQFSSP